MYSFLLPESVRWPHWSLNLLVPTRARCTMNSQGAAGARFPVSARGRRAQQVRNDLESAYSPPLQRVGLRHWNLDFRVIPEQRRTHVTRDLASCFKRGIYIYYICYYILFFHAQRVHRRLDHQISIEMRALCWPRSGRGCWRTCRQRCAPKSVGPRRQVLQQFL